MENITEIGHGRHLQGTWEQPPTAFNEQEIETFRI
jgi:hypothetical protein